MKNQMMIDRLNELLKEAESGNITSFAYAAFRRAENVTWGHVSCGCSELSTGSVVLQKMAIESLVEDKELPDDGYTANV